ncbi:MAG: efflux RND transporter periplasmic adaptor subunit [Selenomonadaceae bacterium]|nr:efflux RND transporter periplasmic adaptor subunit [Selenomonadaceae bacterium]
MMGKRKFVSVVIVLLMAVGGYFYVDRASSAAADQRELELKLSGNVDVREVSLAFRQSDRIAELLVDEGDQVEKDQLLGRLDNRELALQIAKARTQIKMQEAVVLRLHNGTRAEDIAQYEAKVRAAQADLDDVAQHYRRIQDVYDETQGSAITREELATARLQYTNRLAKVEEAQQALNLAVAGPRVEDIDEAEAQLQALNDELARLEFLLTQYELRSPTDGVIRSRLLEVGDMASASTPVFKISLNDKKWVRAYVKETDLSKVREGQAAQVFIDSLPGQALDGQIGFISSTAEFTPKTVQTDELRTSLLYEIRVYVDDAANVLRLGMPATVRVTLR